MAILKMEVDTDDIFQSSEDEYTTFETIVSDAMTTKIKESLVSRFSKEEIAKASKPIATECIRQIENKISVLVNEDIVIEDRWGKPLFIGSVEDYLKKEIDSKLLAQVDSNGKVLSGNCSTNDNTWIKWKVDKAIESYVDKQFKSFEYSIESQCKERIGAILESFQKKTLNKAITDKLATVGIVE